MRIDSGLCHKILSAIEDDPNAGSGQFLQLAIENYEPRVIAYHVKYLWEMDMISGVEVTHQQSPCVPEIAVTDIKPDGRKFCAEKAKDSPRKSSFDGLTSRGLS